MVDLLSLSSPNSSGDWINQAIGGTVAFVIGGAVMAFFGVVGRRAENRQADNRAKTHAEQVAEDKLDAELEALVRQMHAALVTPSPTELIPHPPIGLVDTVAEIKQIQAKVAGRLLRVETTLTQNGGSGNTLLDRISRIESHVGVDPSITAAYPDLTPHHLVD